MFTGLRTTPMRHRESRRPGLAMGLAVGCPEPRPERVAKKPLGEAADGPGGEKGWRRGRDSNPRAGFTRPSDFESAPLWPLRYLSGRRG